MCRREPALESPQPRQKGRKERLADIQATRQERQELRRGRGLGIPHNLPDILDRPGNMVEVLC